MADPFRVRVTVRGYELDTQGHLNQAVYLQYAEHARWECLRAAGVAQDRLIAGGVGPVALEVTVRYLRELRGGDEVDVTCEFRWGEGKTFQIVQDFTRPDETPVASVTGVGGLLDLTARRLVPDPRERFRALATDPTPMGL
ncbi:thioesterase [Micromonospora sp. WMMA2032]|uniref:acyl-CoA thioesterase n=1 Tax=Micromonospora sp. WMMA2032 TaxID=2039870 RepID=UPI000C058067|nr:thioesterase family protein [Micromonospora sp. WMMA2032]ATO12963.1 thioesterase [Micromonospora sp. WMMA2032]